MTGTLSMPARLNRGQLRRFNEAMDKILASSLYTGAINNNPGKDRYAIPFFFDAHVDYPDGMSSDMLNGGQPCTLRNDHLHRL